MISWNVTFDESSFRAAGFDLNSTNTQVNPSQKNKSLKGLLTNDVQVAGQNWSKYLSGLPFGLSTTIDVQIVIDKGPGSAYTESPDPTNPSKGSAVLIGLGFGSANTYQSEAAYKVNTLLDPNFSKPDIVIHISSDYLKNAMWLDPSTFQLDTPADRGRDGHY
jgi:hypothetical protein